MKKQRYPTEKILMATYHPDYASGEDNGHRQDCHARLRLLKKHIKGGSLLDLGCSEGFYSFGLWDICGRAKVMFPITAIEKNSGLYEQCLKSQEKHKTDIRFFNEDILDTFLARGWDNSLYMSVHHHIIEQVGYDSAEDFLFELSHNSKQMFFDMGQKNENCPQHSWHRLLPNTDDSEQWTYDYLKKNTVYDNIEKIGSSPIHGIQRALWKLTMK